MDTIEGIKVALKIPLEEWVDDELLVQFKQEIRLTAKLNHPNILPLKNANFVDGRLIVATPLGIETLDDRLGRRISVAKAYTYFEQMIAAVAYAHDQGIIHCDIKPQNFIIFDDDLVRLADFGIAKLSQLTIAGSGTGTVGHMSVEQAMGKPSLRGDVFSLGLIMYRMLTSNWPEYPFAWPPPGASRLRAKKVHPDMIGLIKKAIDPSPRKRFADATYLESAFEDILPKAQRNLARRRV